MNIKRYSNPLHFKTALDERLRQTIRPGRDLNRVRQFMIFERFLARVASEFEDSIVLKGGLVLELRLARARTTKDVDVRFSGDPHQLLERLQRASRLDLGDFMTFEVALDAEQPAIQGDGTKYEGQRFRVLCKIAGLRYGDAFGLDVAIGDPMVVEPELITLPDRLGFIGIAPPQLRIYPIETHLAEKLHAYTMPRSRINSRDKDLPDIALISTLGHASAVNLRKAIEQTFAFRGTHDIPGSLPRPPASWHVLYPQKLEEYALEWPTLEACYEHACRFLDPVLAETEESSWDPVAAEWRRQAAARNP